MWIKDFSSIRFTDDSDRRDLPDDDFRRLGPLAFKSLAILCANGDVWIKQITAFLAKNRMVSASALPRKLWLSLVYKRFS